MSDDSTDPVKQYITNRRKLLAGTAGIASTALAGCTDGGSSPTPTDATGGGGDGGMDDPSPTPTEEQGMAHPDVDVLNYALVLEHLEHVFYERGLETYSDEELMEADALSQFGEEIRMQVPGRIETVRDHEKAHVETLSGVVEKLGGSPVGQAEYEFGHSTPSGFLKTAKALENTGVAAYKGAAPSVKDNAILKSALGVHSVEARHASFLNLLNASAPFPNAFGKAKTPEEVVDVAEQFVEPELSAPKLGGEGGTADRKTEDDTTDVNVLNYALTLEHLEHAFYRDGLERYSAEQIESADALSQFGSEFRATVPDRLASIRDHEQAHVNAIEKTVKKLGGEPVEEAQYDFGYGNPSEFLGVAKALENTGVAAYAGAAPTVKRNSVFVAAAKIHDVEARHASFLNELNTTSPYSAAVDEAKSMQEVKEIVKQFIEN